MIQVVSQPLYQNGNDEILILYELYYLDKQSISILFIRNIYP
jgi:hypothetical protein